MSLRNVDIHLQYYTASQLQTIWSDLAVDLEVRSCKRGLWELQEAGIDSWNIGHSATVRQRPVTWVTKNQEARLQKNETPFHAETRIFRSSRLLQEVVSICVIVILRSGTTITRQSTEWSRILWRRMARLRSQLSVELYYVTVSLPQSV
jgi:hypothetical protein